MRATLQCHALLHQAIDVRSVVSHAVPYRGFPSRVANLDRHMLSSHASSHSGPVSIISGAPRLSIQSLTLLVAQDCTLAVVGFAQGWAMQNTRRGSGWSSERPYRGFSSPPDATCSPEHLIPGRPPCLAQRLEPCLGLKNSKRTYSWHGWPTIGSASKLRFVHFGYPSDGSHDWYCDAYTELQGAEMPGTYKIIEIVGTSRTSFC
jgi:hypothetical protein